MFNYLKTFAMLYLPKDEKGQDAAEYALLIALIALAIIAAVGVLGTTIGGIFSDIGSDLENRVP